MPSSYTSSARFTLQATGENNNTWGVILNQGVFQLVDDALCGRLALPVSGAVTLTTNQGATDQARMAFLDFSGAGGNVVIPSVPKGYFVHNAAAAGVTLIAGGAGLSLNAGDAGPVFTDGTTIYPVMIGGKTIKAYVDAGDAASKSYTDMQIAGAIINMPSVVGQAGKLLTTDGNIAFWGSELAGPLTVDGALVGLSGAQFNTATIGTLTVGANASVGGTLTASTPTAGDNSTHVATTAFVAGAVPVASSTVPLMSGTAAVGTGTTWARADHVHPIDTSRAPAAAHGYVTQAGDGHTIQLGWNGASVDYSIDGGTTSGALLPLAGGTLTGQLNGTALSMTGTISGTGGINLYATGTNNCQFALFDSSATLRGMFVYMATGAAAGAIEVTNSVTGGIWSLDNSGNCIAAPGGSGAGNFLVTNNAHGYQAGGGSWVALSDSRIKTVEADYAVGLDEVLQLRPVVYRYKGNDALAEGALSMHQLAADAQTQFVGLVAQEAEAIIPGMVSQREGWIDGKPVDDLRVLDNSELVYALVNAVKTLSARVRALEH